MELINEINGWILSDSEDEDFTYMKKHGNHRYEFIRSFWGDFCDKDDPNKDHIVQIVNIDLSDYTEDELECYVSSRFDSIADIRATYTRPLTEEEKEILDMLNTTDDEKREMEEIEKRPWTQEDTEDIIAECVFDESDFWEIGLGVVTGAEAREYVLDYIKNN